MDNLDILKFCILPHLYKDGLLTEHFKGNPESGYLELKDAWNAPHLNIISQLKNISELRGVNKNFRYLTSHPFDIPFKEKLNFAKASTENEFLSNRIRKKIIYKIANKIKPKNTGIVIENIWSDYQRKVKYNRILLHQEMKEKFEPKPYHFSNDTCLYCDGWLPIYSPSIRKNWTRSISEGFVPHFLLKRTCSRRCYKKLEPKFICTKCSKKCSPGTDFRHGNQECAFTMMLLNPDTAEVSVPKYVSSKYTTEFVCSMKCLQKIRDFHLEFNTRNVIIRATEIPEVYGFVIDADILNEIVDNNYIVKDIVRILNPEADDFTPN
jgi:hypothetical protein